MADSINKRAMELEEMLPRVMRSLYKPAENDPLSDIPVAQLRLIRVLFPNPKTHSAVSEELRISVSAVTQVANRLELLGLVERVEGGADRRVKNLKLTTWGLECMQKRQGHRVEQIKEVLTQMSEDAQRELLARLDDLVAACLKVRGNEPGIVLASDLAQTGGLPLLGGSSQGS